MKSDLFQACGHCWVFQSCWHTECSTFTASSFRIWNSSTGIPSLPLALFLVMLPRAHLTSHPGCLALGEWSHHCDYLGHEDLFCTVFCVFLPPLLNIFCSVRSLPFLSFIEPIFAWNVLSNFLEEISSLSHFVVFLYFFALITGLVLDNSEWKGGKQGWVLMSTMESTTFSGFPQLPSSLSFVHVFIKQKYINILVCLMQSQHIGKDPDSGKD